MQKEQEAEVKAGKDREEELVEIGEGGGGEEEKDWEEELMEGD